jgi:hypothetical protein
MMRCLALAHFAWGLLLVAVATYLGIGMLRMLPHLSSGTVWTNLPGVLLMATVYALPAGSLGLWMIVLGRWAWTKRPCLRLALLVTHGLLLLPGTLAVVVGVHALRAAERSTASGGGIMSPLAAIPLVFGVPVLILALGSIVAALTVTSSARRVTEGVRQLGSDKHDG